MIVGVIDDNPLLRGRFFRGYRILGGIECLEEHVVKSHIDEILILTDNLTDEHFDKVIEIAKRHKLAVMRLRCLEESVMSSYPVDSVPQDKTTGVESAGEPKTGE